MQGMLSGSYFWHLSYTVMKFQGCSCMCLHSCVCPCLNTLACKCVLTLNLLACTRKCSVGVLGV